MRRAIVMAAVLMAVFAHSLAQAQEREPLVMRIELGWTVAGTMLGAGVGVAMWLTDPGNPNNLLARQIIEGAAIGTIVGAGFGIYRIQQTAQIPARFAFSTDPLDPINRTTRDPIAAQAQREDLLASVGRSLFDAHTIPLANFRMRF